MKLAERGVFLQAGRIWAREVRRLLDSGHQTPVVATDYRTPAESAMTNILREVQWDGNDARALLRAVYCNQANIDTDPVQGILHVRLHYMPSRVMDAAVRYCAI